MLTTLALLIVAASLVWIARSLREPKAHERAGLLSGIARDGAALVVSLNPKADWATLLKLTVDQIAAAAGTTNRDAIERAAAGALTALGKNPNR